MRLFLFLPILLVLCCSSRLPSVSCSSARFHALQQHHRQQQAILQQDVGLQTQLLSIAERARAQLRLHEQSHDEIKHQFITSLMELAQERANIMMNISMIETKQIIYKCTCTNGVHAVDEACTANMEKCVACKLGFKLSGNKCIPNSYINIYAYPRVNQATCWPEGHVCWDDMGENSCHLRCCSQNYRQATSGVNAGKDVCTRPGPCWNKGTKCWDNDGQDSCKWRCCSHTWFHDDVRDYDVCDAPAPMAEAISGYDTKSPVDDQLRVNLFTTIRSCWTAGTRCWNNDGQDSCWERCCSKSYYHDPNKNSDVCAPIPADKKCYAQYTPCWNSLPVPQGNFYVEVRNNQKVYYPSCFQCCARVRNSDGGSRWPAWTEYYIGNGNHDSTSEATHWWDAFVAGAENANPVQFIIDAAKPTDPNRAKRGGNDIASNVASSMAESGAKLGTKLAVKAAINAMNAGMDTNPVTAGVGVVFSFFYGFFSKLTEPKWDLCD